MPNYLYRCPECREERVVQRKIAHRDEPIACAECDDHDFAADVVLMHRVFEAPNVMNVALADGTSRFADLKSHLALERAKRGQDKAEKKKLESEQKKVWKETA